jgi:hypothetical protein
MIWLAISALPVAYWIGYRRGQRRSDAQLMEAVKKAWDGAYGTDD